METAGGRKLGVSDFVFEIADLAPKPMQTKVRFRVDAPVPTVAEILSSDRWSEFSGVPIDPATSKGATAAVVTLAMPAQERADQARNDVHGQRRPEQRVSRQAGDESKA